LGSKRGIFVSVKNHWRYYKIAEFCGLISILRAFLSP
jgi:hypothetical protein